MRIFSLNYNSHKQACWFININQNSQLFVTSYMFSFFHPCNKARGLKRSETFATEECSAGVKLAPWTDSKLWVSTLRSLQIGFLFVTELSKLSTLLIVNLAWVDWRFSKKGFRRWTSSTTSSCPLSLLDVNRQSQSWCCPAASKWLNLYVNRPEACGASGEAPGC